MKVIFWSDFNCPYSYIGLNRLSQAIDELNVDCQWKMMAFELSEDLKFTSGEISEIKSICESEGLDINIASFTPSRDAHRLVKFTQASYPDVVLKLIFKIFEANFKNPDISSHDVLVSISGKCGLDENIIREFLSTNKYNVEVEVECEEAVLNGITAVPHYIIHTKNHQLIVPGAFEKDAFKTAIEDLISGEISGKTFL